MTVFQTRILSINKYMPVDSPAFEAEIPDSYVLLGKGPLSFEFVL